MRRCALALLVTLATTFCLGPVAAEPVLGIPTALQQVVEIDPVLADPRRDEHSKCGSQPRFG